MLDGKCKIQFEKWIEAQQFPFIGIKPRQDEINFSNELPFEMQSGVLIVFFDSVSLVIELFIDSSFEIQINGDFTEGVFTTRNEALKSAFEQANNTYNKN